MAIGVVDVAEEVEVGHDQGQRPFEALRAAELLGQRRREVASVEESRLRIDARLRLELRDAQGAVHEDQRCDGERDQPRVRLPERERGDAEGREHEIRGEVLHVEEAGLAESESACEAKHHREIRVVDRHEDEATGDAGDAEPQRVVGEPSGIEHEVMGEEPHRHRRERVVADVERLQIPAVAHAQPFGDVLHDPHQRDEFRRKEQRRRNQEHDGRVVGLVARRADDEELRDRRGRAEDQERRPVLRVLEPAEERERRGRGRERDDGEVDFCFQRQRLFASRGFRRESDFGRSCAHSWFLLLLPR